MVAFALLQKPQTLHSKLQDKQWAVYTHQKRGQKLLCTVPLRNSCEDCAKTQAEGLSTQWAIQSPCLSYNHAFPAEQLIPHDRHSHSCSAQPPPSHDLPSIASCYRYNTMSWEETVLKSQDPDWREKFMEANLVRKSEHHQNFTPQDGGKRVTAGSRMEVSDNMLSQAPGQAI